jgi:hypothetical protein
MNIVTNGNENSNVHAPHRNGRPVPACMTARQIQGLHFSTPTDAPVNCKRCAA